MIGIFQDFFKSNGSGYAASGLGLMAVLAANHLGDDVSPGDFVRAIRCLAKQSIFIRTKGSCPNTKKGTAPMAGPQSTPLI